MIISEILPNPVGKDTDGEWFELFNDGATPISLHGWVIVDASGKKFAFGDKVISSGQYAVFPYATTKISLNNQGETLTLFNQSGVIADEFVFQGVTQEGWSVVRSDGSTSFSATPTPNAVNTVAVDRTQYSELVSQGPEYTQKALLQELPAIQINVFLGAALTGILCATFGVWILSRYRYEKET